MTTLTPTKADGAAAKASDTVYVERELQMTEDRLPKALVDSDLNAEFVADFFSAVLAHERCGRHLYRSVAERSNNPVLRQKYEHFGKETEHHVEVMENLITRLGGNPNYVSPMARAVEGSDTKLLESTFLLGGSLDPMTQESVMLDAVFIAESVDQAHWQLMAKLREEASDGDVKDALESAVNDVGPDEDEHLEWARTAKEKITILQAKHSAAASAGMKMEEMVARVREWLS